MPDCTILIVGFNKIPGGGHAPRPPRVFRDFCFLSLGPLTYLPIPLSSLADQIEQNESLKTELDDIVSGLQGYLEGVKGQSVQHRQDFQMLLQEKEGLEEKVRRLEAELSILDTEAQNAKILLKVGGWAL